MRLGWRGLFGLIVSAATIWWLVAWSGINWPDAWRYIHGANIWLLLLAAGVGTLMFPLRAIRWRVILEPVAPNIAFSALWHGAAIGMMGNNILPARGGEFARAFTLSYEEPSVPFSTAFASLFVDRAFDALVMLLLMLVAIFAPGFPLGAQVWGEPVARWAAGIAVLVAALAAGLYVLVFFPDRMIGVWTWLSRRLVPRLHAPGVRVLRGFADGLSVLRHPARFAAVFGWTVLHWLAQGLAFWIGFKAVGVPASFFAALFVQAAIAFAVSLPSSPGFFGIWEAAAKVGLAVYGVDPNIAAAWAISYHIVSLIPITAIGLYYVWRLGLTFGQLGGGARGAAAVAGASGASGVPGLPDVE